MKTLRYIKMFGLLAVLAIGLNACSDNNDIAENYYSSTKMTAAQLLDNRPEEFSQFIDILKRSNYYSLLSTYGEFTVFAPNNDAVNRYLTETGYQSVNNIPPAELDTLARTHIVRRGAYFTTDVSDDALPEMNMNDRYIVLSSDSDANNNNALVIYVNKRARIVEKDDSVTNGVVHVVNNVLTASNLFLPDLIQADSTVSLFAQALFLTHMNDSLSHYIDETYSCEDDSVTFGVRTFYGGYWQQRYFPEKRYFKFTAFVEPDKVYNEAGIYNIEDLKAYAKRIYDEVYPQDAGLYDDDYTNRKNPLNRFVSYHLIDRIGNYGDWAPSGEIKAQCCVTSVWDPEDFYPTICPGTVVRFCSPSAGLFINRKGLGNNASVRGVRVLSPSESGDIDQGALNGVYHYIDKIMAYTTQVRDDVLNCRFRIDATTLSRDFMNQGGRGHFGEDHLVGFKPGFIDGWIIKGETEIGVHSKELHWHSYQGDAMLVGGIYDVSIQLPPVPSNTYEVRLAYTVGRERGVVQAYLNDGDREWACGIPIDLRVYSGDQTIGAVADTEDPEENKANDKAMHNRGYMKGIDSYRSAGGEVFRNNTENLRRILTTAYLDNKKTYHLRLRQVLEDKECHLSFDYIELCPKSIYGSPEGEDTH